MTTSTAPTQAAQDGRIGWSLAAAGTVTAVFTLFNAPTPLYVHWQHEWGFSSGTLTVVFAAYMVGLIATLLTAGVLADRHGRKAVLLPGMVAASPPPCCSCSRAACSGSWRPASSQESRSGRR